MIRAPFGKPDLPDALGPEKRRALREVALFDPATAAIILALSVSAAVLEGIGVSFILPIVQNAGAGVEATSGGGGRLMELFLSVYAFLGVPFQLEYLLVGLAAVMGVRHAASFLAVWLQAKVGASYVRSLKQEAFDLTLDARVDAIDDHGSSELLNAVVTETNYPANVLSMLVRGVEEATISLVYLAIALYLAPWLTLFVVVLLGGTTVLVRFVVEPAYATGGRLADANERIQEAAQSTIQGIRTVRTYTLRERMRGRFADAVDRYATARVVLARNSGLIDRAYRFASALIIFGLIYLAFTSSSLSLGSAGVFLFAMFRLAPRFSRLNGLSYSIAGGLPHLGRTRKLTDELAVRTEPAGGEATPSAVSEVAFDGVTAAYGDGAPAIRDVSFSVRRGEFAAFVGPSGAGKSTIVSLLCRFREPDAGSILADGRPIDRFDVHDWRGHVAVVRQRPYLFDDTLRYNVAVGDPDASRAAIERACETARVTEFVDDLPDGYDTDLGDDGVRLSGGQRQRVAIARAILKDADVLVFDEATSELDATLEADIHEAIASSARDRILVAAAHRFSAIHGADRIYVIEDGVVTDAGDHGELVDGNETYARLYATQQGPG